MEGTIDNVKVSVRSHAPNDKTGNEFDGPDAIDKAVLWLMQVKSESR